MLSWTRIILATGDDQSINERLLLVDDAKMPATTVTAITMGEQIYGFPSLTDSASRGEFESNLNIPIRTSQPQ